MLDAPEANEKPDMFAAHCTEVRSVCADLTALEGRIRAPSSDIDSRTLPYLQKEAVALQERLENTWNEVKNKFESIRLKVSEVQAQLDVLQQAELDVDVSTSSVSETFAPTKSFCRRLPQLPADVVVRVLRNVCVRDIGNARLVCRLWKHAVDTHEVELWEARCNALELLPPPGTNTVLGRATGRVRSRIEVIRKEAAQNKMRSELATVFRRHYFTWARQICYQGEATTLHSLKECCTKPSDLKWVRWRRCSQFDFFELLKCDVSEFTPNGGAGFELIDEQASDSVVQIPPGDERPDIYNEGGQIRQNIYANWDLVVEFLLKKVVEIGSVSLEFFCEDMIGMRENVKRLREYLKHDRKMKEHADDIFHTCFYAFKYWKEDAQLPIDDIADIVSEFNVHEDWMFK